MGTIWDGDLTQTADEVSSCWTFTVNILETGYTTDGMSIHRPVDSVKCSFVDAYVEMAYYNQYNWNFATAPSPPSGWPQGAKDAVTAWAATLPTPDGPDYIATCNVYIAKAVSGSNSDAVYLGTGFYEYLIPGTGKRTKQHGPRDWSLAAGFELNDAIMRIRCGAEEQEKRANIRSWHDRFAQAIVCGDENTSVTAFIGTATATHTYTFPTGEFPPGNPISGTIIIGGESSQLSIALGMAELPTTNTSYASITDLQWGGVECDLGLERITFWTDDGGATWDVSEDDPGGSYYAHLFADSDAITVQRVQAGDESLIASVNCQILGPIRYNLIAQRFAVGTDFDVLATEEEWSAYTGLNQYVDEDTYEPVYLGEGLSDYYTQVWWYSGADVDNRIKTGEYYFDFSFAGCEVKASYLEAEHEDLSSEGDEDAPYGIDYSQTNKYGMVVLPSIASTLDSTEPYWPGAVDLSWSEISADIPPGESSRPTDWIGSGSGQYTQKPSLKLPRWTVSAKLFDLMSFSNITGGVVVNNATNEWVVGSSGGTVSRTLAARWPYRFDYVAADVPESGWFNSDFAIWNKANCCLDEDDLPAAVTAVPVEDVVNYDNSSWAELSFAAWPETAEGQTISVTLTYYTVSITDPWYTCAEHRYMAPEGEWDYIATQRQITIDGTLSAAGIVLFDLGKLKRTNTIKLQRVAAVSLAFPAGAAGTYEFADWRLVADAEVADDPVINFQAGIAPWNFLEDFTGAGGTASGVACLNLDYGYEDKRGEQWGMTQTQYRQHCPERSASGDISEAKALSRMVNELNWQEQLTATYGTAAVAAAMVDEDENCMGQGPFWWDTERGTGDALTGAGGIAVRNLVAVPYGTGPVPVTVNAYWTCGGRVHGIAYNGGERDRNGSSINFYRRPKTGGDWESCGSCDPDGYGRFCTPPMPEAFYQYRIGDDEDVFIVSTRQYTLSEYVISEGNDLFLVEQVRNIVYVLYYDGESIKLIYTAPPDKWFDDGIKQAPYVNPHTVAANSDGSPSGYITANSLFYVYHVSSNVVRRLLSVDWGNNWAGDIAVISGQDISRFAAYYSNGVSYGFGITSSGAFKFYRSNDHFTTYSTFNIASGKNESSQPTGYFEHGILYAYCIDGSNVSCYKSENMGQTWSLIS